MQAVTVEAIAPDTPVAKWCLDQYYDELRVRFDGGFDPRRSVLPDASGFTHPKGTFLVAKMDGDPVGCGALTLVAADVAYIKRMWIAPSARGMGLGRMLLAALERAALDLGCEKVQLETNRVLTEAILLYRSAGYEEVEPFNDEPYAHHWFARALTDPSGAPA